MNYLEISNRIKELRVDKCGNKHGAQKDFALFLGLKYTTYVNYEKGRVTPEILVLLNEKIGVSTDWLLTGKEPEPTKAPVPLRIDSASAPDELICTGQLLKILRGRNKANVTAIKTNLHAFALTSDIDVPDGDNGDKQAELQAAEEKAPYGKKNNHA